MKTSIGCLQTDELRQMLDGSLSGERQQECTAHMDSCECCQARIEELAVEGTNLSQVVGQLQESQPVANSAYWPALKALDRSVAPESRDSNPEMQQTFVPKSSPTRRDVALDFLEPASDSAYLGRIAHFDVMRVLGRGGMGLVLEAFDSRLQRNVALKVLDPDLAEDEVARQRFCREARAAASITHENVVAVHQVEKAGGDGLPFLVMQLIGGESLEQRLAREKQLSFREIVRIGMQAAKGLAAAHALGMVHRDVKPGNILLETSEDRVKLTDFGLAHVAEDVKLTRTGFVSGTPLYMAPEQALGEPSDHRSDLFSLGAVLYEMCAGRPPFTGNSALAILKQIADAKHRPLRELNPSIPDWFAEVVDRLLAKKPGDRIQTAAQLAELLEYEWALMKTTSDDVPAVCAIEERKRTVRNRWIAAAIGTTFLALGLAGGWFISNRGPGPDAVPGSSAEPVAVLAANAGAVWSVAFDPAGDNVVMAVEDGSIRVWDLPAKSIKSTFHAHNGVVWVSRYSPNGELFATAGDDGLIKLWNLPQADVAQTFEHPNAVRGLAFGHSDRRIFAGSRDGSLNVWSPDSREPLLEARQPGAAYVVAISPDDETLASAGSDKVVWLWNAKNLTQKLKLEGHSGPIFSLAFLPDGRRLASVGWDKTIRIWDTSSGLLLKSWKGHESDIWSIACTPDGTKLATGGTDGAAKVWNAETGELLATFFGHKSGIHTVAFNRDGTLLASGGRDGAVRIWPIQ
ncbi:MAG: serine/threonine protein kinase [Planctomycetia bacterium]|nr:serine/threonine protein kinase [Planctomycetia bacterium]